MNALKSTMFGGVGAMAGMVVSEGNKMLSLVGAIHVHVVVSRTLITHQ